MSSLYRAFSEQGPTFEGRSCGVEFRAGISGPIGGHEAAALGRLGSFGLLPWDDSVEVTGWDCSSSAPARWTPILVGRAPAVACSDATGALPLFNLDQVDLPDELPECYRALFELYQKPRRGRR